MSQIDHVDTSIVGHVGIDFFTRNCFCVLADSLDCIALGKNPGVSNNGLNSTGSQLINSQGETRKAGTKTTGVSSCYSLTAPNNF